MVYDSLCCMLMYVQQQTVVRAESRVEANMTLHLIQVTKLLRFATTRQHHSDPFTVPSNLEV